MIVCGGYHFADLGLEIPWSPLAPLRIQTHDHRSGSLIVIPLEVLFRRVPYFFGDLKRDLDLENYPAHVLSGVPLGHGP